MKKHMILRYLFVAALIITFAACDDDNYSYDNIAPDPPRNVSVYPGDLMVEIEWDKNRESDIAGYNVYYSYTYWGEYTLIGSTENNYYVDYDVDNGDLYYYAVAAYDYNGNESELSYDEVYGVPRPEGMNQSILDYLRFPNSSGYDFSEFAVGPYNEITNDYSVDFFFENYNGTYYLNVWDDGEIQDMGATQNIYDITYAPISGWVPLVEGENVKYTEAKVGHTYVILTWDNHFAKVRISSITTERIFFDWAYQLLEGERQLKRKEITEKRNSIPGKVIKKY